MGIHADDHWSIILAADCEKLLRRIYPLACNTENVYLNGHALLVCRTAYAPHLTSEGRMLSVKAHDIGMGDI